jgi:mannose-6-phosphate isomerase
LSLKENEALADCFLPQKGRVRMKTTLKRDGRLDWEERIGKNLYSYRELHQILQTREIARSYAEKKRWEGYYQRREEIMPGLKEMALFKPVPDNLVETVWGGEKLEALKGLPSSGRKIGESWECSTHFLHPSKIQLKRGIIIPLSHILAIKGKQILGKGYQDFKGEPPFFLKFIEAKENLSVQVHPGDKEAKELGEEDRGKEEAWLILEAEQGAKIFLGFKCDVDKDAFKRDLLTSDIDIAHKYLNAIPVTSGDLFHIPAGTIHALGGGVMLAEIQQTSGITYRVWDWHRFPKRRLHIEKAMYVLNFKKTDKEDFLRFARKRDKEVILLDTPSFRVNMLNLKAKEEVWQDIKEDFQILACLKGEFTIEAEGSKEILLPLQSLLVSAKINGYTIYAQKESTILKSFPPSLHSFSESSKR